MKPFDDKIYQLRTAAFHSLLNCEPDEAEARLNDAISLEPDEPALYVDLSVVRRYDGRFREAQQALAEAFERDENFPAALHAQGELHQWMGRRREAIACLQMAADRFPQEQAVDLATVHNGLATLYWDEGEPEKAVEHAVKSLDYVPNGYRAQKNLRYFDRNDLRPQAGRLPYIGRLFEFVKRSEKLADLKSRAFREFFGTEQNPVITGKDPFDGEMAFLDWFLFEYPGALQTSLDAFFEAEKANLSEADRRIYEQFGAARFSFFELKVEPEEGIVECQDLMDDGRTYRAIYPLAKWFLRTGLRVSVRLVPAGENYVFSGVVGIWNRVEIKKITESGAPADAVQRRPLTALHVWNYQREAKQMEWENFNKAVELYNGGRYWDAWNLLNIQLADHPMDPRRNFYAALTMVEMNELRKSAMRMRFVIQQDPYHEEPGYPHPRLLLKGIVQAQAGGDA